MRFDTRQLADLARSRRVQLGAAAALLAAIVVLALLIIFDGPRRPPSIFDTPVDGVFSFLGDEDFNSLSMEERLKFINGVAERFGKMSQSESAVAAAFFAGLTGPASEQMINNARVLGKDILVEGAGQYLSLSDEAQRKAFLDQWLVRWARFGEQVTGRSTGGGGGQSDEALLNEMTRQGQREQERGIEINAEMTQQVIEFWDRDIASVANPAEQAQIFQFLPALRSHILNRKGEG